MHYKTHVPARFSVEDQMSEVNGQRYAGPRRMD